ncbi:MAG: AbrB/MazE/SpoVT family DNA-binding domain-containing protein [Treponema sp.]|jgi:antitoxin VapB|nr:AbrB/MazE/SpoVT family DNA-binding domain-containing protein [Treponema sp.]
MAETAKIFTSGRSQAVRLPKNFRFTGSEVYIKKEKGNVILSEKPFKTWKEIFGDFRGDPGFSVHRELLKDKPRRVKL